MVSCAPRVTRAIAHATENAAHSGDDSTHERRLSQSPALITACHRATIAFIAQRGGIAAGEQHTARLHERGGNEWRMRTLRHCKRRFVCAKPLCGRARAVLFCTCAGRFDRSILLGGIIPRQKNGTGLLPDAIFGKTLSERRGVSDWSYAANSVSSGVVWFRFALGTNRCFMRAFCSWTLEAPAGVLSMA